MYRIAGAIAALVFAVLLGWTILEATRTEQVVVPTNRVIDRGPADDLPAGRQAREVLAQRTALQAWRGATGPSPAAPEDTAITGQPLPAGSAEATAPELVLGWLASRDEDWDLLRERGFLEGRVVLPADNLAVLQQPQGRTWRGLHNEEIVFGGGVLIFGFSLLLALFLAWRGRVPVEEGFSGRRIERFGAFERANHWVTAVSFLLIALSGLLLLYGQYLLKPLLGAEAYQTWALVAVYVHMAFALPFVLGVVSMFVLWVRQNGFSGVDLQWLKRFGGFLPGQKGHPPAWRFNTGQKLIFWAVVLGMLSLLATGLSLMFPFFWLEITGMQAAQLLHAAIGLAMIAVIIGHIYIGTVGMEGAFDAMWRGDVDCNWAEEHHDLWVAERQGRRPHARG